LLTVGAQQALALALFPSLSALLTACSPSGSGGGTTTSSADSAASLLTQTFTGNNYGVVQQVDGTGAPTRMADLSFTLPQPLDSLIASVSSPVAAPGPLAVQNPALVTFQAACRDPLTEQILLKPIRVLLFERNAQNPRTFKLTVDGPVSEGSILTFLAGSLSFNGAPVETIALTLTGNGQLRSPEAAANGIKAITPTRFELFPTSPTRTACP
jgi:hypothetical protein